MILVVILHHLDAAAFVGVCDNCNRPFCGSLCFLNGIIDFIDIMAVNLHYIKTEGLPFIRQGFQSHDLFGGAVYHEAVPVQDGDKVVQFVM